MRLLLIFLLPLSIYASKILSYNIYDRTDRVDVMITFDTPYDGEIRQSKSKHNIIIKLEDATIESSKLKKLSSKYITSLSMTPMMGYTKIVASIPESVSLKASKTSDGYGLRLRFSNGVSYKKKNNTTQNEQNPFSSLPTKKSTEISTSYFVVVGLLFVAIIILFFVKKKLSPKNKNNSQWLFKQNATPKKTSNEDSKKLDGAENVSIRFQKSLNDENSVVMLDFGDQSYLVLMGKSNILLDKFTDNKPTTQSDFETILQSRHQQLENFLNDDNKNNTLKNINKPLLDAYTNKASTIPNEI